MDRKAEDFEKPIAELEKQIHELTLFPASAERDARLAELEKQLDATRRQIYGNLSRWQVTLVARHPDRPYTLDYIGRLFNGFVELHGDRQFGDDPAIVSGFAELNGHPVCIVGQQKGRTTKSKLHRNFGMPHPEGYRKALRVMKLAEKFSRPVLTFVDTPGAYPGSGAEARGVAEAIAKNLREMAVLRVPVIVTVIGEGGSGGALGIGVGDRVNILQYATYSVISPESCSSILWRDPDHPEEAADALKLTAPDLREMGLVDEIIGEPEGGAHNDPEAMASALGVTLERQLDELRGLDLNVLIEQRYQKFRAMGALAGIEE
ncbi:MAG: acetyl-CoA carboxylase carboxyltransferase subunit alpha [Acidobacteriota bacterium]|jgi:acetyl-CoA carboxylase carboxyl transferase subunit alpha